MTLLDTDKSAWWLSTAACVCLLAHRRRGAAAVVDLREPEACSLITPPISSAPITDARRLEPVRQNLRVIEYRTPAEIEQMRPAGRFVADVLSALIARADVGVNLLELDELAHQMIRDRGAESCYINYHPSFGASPFGKVLCTSVNDAVLHGLPHDYELLDGDLISLDFAASVNGWVSDSAISLIVGSPREQDQQLIATAEGALAAGIEAALPGNKLGDVSFAIARVGSSGRLQDQH